MSTELTTKKDLKSIINSPAVMDRLKDILGKNAAVFATSVVQITQQNAMLAQAEPNSIIGAAMTAATLNLPLNNSLGFAYIVPYNESQKDGTNMVKAQFQIGWKGFVQLAIRTGLYKFINPTDVRQGELIHRDRLSGEMEFDFIEDDAARQKLPVIGYVAYFKLLSGFEGTHFMSMAEMQKHAKKFSKTYQKDKGMWVNDFETMALKTVLKLLLSKKAPLSIEMQRAIETDQAIINDVDAEDYSYSDNKIVELDHNLERQRSLVDTAISYDDFEFAESNVTDEDLRKELFKKLIDNVSDAKDFEFAETLIDDEVLQAELKVKKAKALKAVETKEPKKSKNKQ